jgi:PBP1b-binding outer membrane lipoprotein LpoB
VKLLVLLIMFILTGCSAPTVEVGKVTIVIQEPIKTADKGEGQ